jgi:Na+-translocating ferredoxin:NAD+ oxidoreductase RnfD subunit
LIGIVAIIIRSFSLFTEGIMFAILIVNAFVPLIDRNIKIIKDRKKAGKKVTA